MATVLAIALPSFTVNPVALGSSTKLSAYVWEVTQTEYTQVITSGEGFTSGEV